MFVAKTDHISDELLNFLTYDWEMKERYAKACMDAYRKPISKLHKEGKRDSRHCQKVIIQS